jgi:hypothetical protein
MKRLVFEKIDGVDDYYSRCGGGNHSGASIMDKWGVTPHPTGQTVIEVEARVLPQEQPATDDEMTLAIACVSALGSHPKTIATLRSMRDEILASRREREGRG